MANDGAATAADQPCQAGAKNLHVIPGHHCNLSCDHCATSSGPNERLRLQEEDFERIAEAMRLMPPPLLSFTGGEPTFYIDSVNRIISYHPKPSSSFEVLVTTNGWFARSDSSIERILGRFLKLDNLQLSYDRWHGNTQDIAPIMALADWSKAHQVKFNISVVLANPEDITFADDIQRRTGVLVIYTRLESAGRAKTRGLGFTFAQFQPEVMAEKCPTQDTVTYFPGRGFSLCCSNLAFNGGAGQFMHRTLQEHLSSGFYKEMQTKTMGGMLQARGLSQEGFAPQFSSVCGMCELIHQHEIKTGNAA